MKGPAPFSYVEALRNDPHYVYRLYDAEGDLLYIGCTVSPRQRRHGHMQSSPWFKDVDTFRLTIYPNRPHAMRVEREAIYTEDPRYNVHGRRLWVVPA